MPRISSFYGIIIYMFFRDHNPPHFHAEYGENKAMISIKDFALLEGTLPPKALALVVEWASQHTRELNDNWERMLKGEPFQKIEPLK